MYPEQNKLFLIFPPLSEIILLGVCYLRYGKLGINDKVRVHLNIFQGYFRVIGRVLERELSRDGKGTSTCRTNFIYFILH